MEKKRIRRARTSQSPGKGRTAKPAGQPAPAPEILLLAPAPLDNAVPVHVEASIDFAQFLTPTPRKPRAARPKTAKGKTAKRGSSRGKTAAKVPPRTKAKATAKPRDKIAKQRGHPVETPPVIALPDLAEPLVVAVPEPAPVPPPVADLLPRARALALHRPGGFLALLSHWLDESGRRVDRFLARRRKSAKARPAVPAPAAPVVSEVDRLRAENEALKQQLDSLLAVQKATVPQD